MERMLGLLVALIATGAVGYLVTAVAIRPFWLTVRIAAKRHDLPRFVGSCVGVFVVSSLVYWYFKVFWRPRIGSQTPLILTYQEILAGIGFGLMWVGFAVHALRRRYEVANAAERIVANTVFEDGRCFYCGAGVDGKRVSHEQYLKLWEDTPQRIRGHYCESCSLLSCFNCKAMAVAWPVLPDASEWDAAVQAKCAKCGTRPKLIAEDALIHASEGERQRILAGGSQGNS